MVGPAVHRELVRLPERQGDALRDEASPTGYAVVFADGADTFDDSEKRFVGVFYESRPEYALRSSAMGARPAVRGGGADFKYDEISLEGDYF